MKKDIRIAIKKSVSVNKHKIIPNSTDIAVEFFRSAGALWRHVDSGKWKEPISRMPTQKVLKQTLQKKFWKNLKN